MRFDDVCTLVVVVIRSKSKKYIYLRKFESAGMPMHVDECLAGVLLNPFWNRLAPATCNQTFSIH
jgi:hypothetical protein